jgi:serine/threonine protein phosphatase PrpC
VLCDGVSASYDPDVASAVAAQTAGVRLADAGPEGVAAAITAAAGVVAALATTGDPRRAVSNPACTIVAACLRGVDIGYGWVGDSRAYWVPPEGPAEQLTVDDSGASHAIALGADPQLALAGPDAHVITAWLGADSPDTDPRVGVHRATASGNLVLCSDGLWNYLPDPDAFAATVREHLHEAGGKPLAAARSVTAYANAEGGADNITVVLIPVVAS